MSVGHSNFDMSQVKEFYDPHPCPYGALNSVPVGKNHVGIKEVLRQLNGQSMAVGNAVAMLKAVAEKNRVDVDEGKKHIWLEVLYDNLPYDKGHTFIIIKFR